MTRPIRLEFPGALFHVTSRGNGKQDIFLDDADRNHFIDLLADAVERWDWILTAYVLMTNHFHLVLQLTAKTLSRGLHWLNGEYAKSFNRRHGRVGHLLQGRPDTPLVDKEEYYLNVLRYAVLNPVRARMVAAPEDYKWSSHRAVLGLAPAPDWLSVDDVLVQFGPEREIARGRYRAYVDAGIGIDTNPWKDLIGQIYLGREAWLDEVRDRVKLRPRSDEHSRLQRNVGEVAMADVVAAVAGTLAIEAADVRIRKTPRLIAAWLASNEAFLTNRQIAAGLRLRSESHVSRLVRKSAAEISADPALQACVDRCVSTLRGK